MSVKVQQGTFALVEGSPDGSSDPRAFLRTLVSLVYRFCSEDCCRVPSLSRVAAIRLAKRSEGCS